MRNMPSKKDKYAQKFKIAVHYANINHTRQYYDLYNQNGQRHDCSTFFLKKMSITFETQTTEDSKNLLAGKGRRLSFIVLGSLNKYCESPRKFQTNKIKNYDSACLKKPI